MASILLLPREIQDRILERLLDELEDATYYKADMSGVHALHAISQTCRTFHNYAQPVLYSNITICHDVLLLLRTFDEAPHLGKLVQKMRTVCWGIHQRHVGSHADEHLARANRVAKEFDLHRVSSQTATAQSATPYFRSFDDRPFSIEPLAALVMQYCPNLRQLEYRVTGDIPCLGRPTLFPHLLDLVISNSVDSDWTYIDWDDTNDWLLASAPNLQSIRATYLSGKNINKIRRYDSVTEVDFSFASRTPADFVFPFSSFPGLRRLTVRAEQAYCEHYEFPIDRTIRAAKDCKTLQHFGVFMSWASDGSWGQGFKSAADIGVESIALDKSSIVDFEPSDPDFYVKLFPSHLKHISLFIFNGDDDWNLRALAELVPTHLPNLESLKVEFYTCDAINDDYYALEEFRKRGISVSFNEDYLDLSQDADATQDGVDGSL